jgi:hypothetical protein
MAPKRTAVVARASKGIHDSKRIPRKSLDHAGEKVLVGWFTGSFKLLHYLDKLSNLHLPAIHLLVIVLHFDIRAFREDIAFFSIGIDNVVKSFS